MAGKLRLIFVVLLSISPLFAGDGFFEIHPVGEGVFVAVAQPHRPENANSMIVILDDGVLLVDTASTPSSARALLGEIRKLTPKPIRYIVNTHFHWDHFWGNQAMREAYPGVQIISTESARLDMERMGLGTAYRDRLVKSELPEAFERWRSQLGNETDPQRLELLRTKVDQWSTASDELKAMTMALPDVTFTDRLVLTGLGEPIEILAPGRGHTAGDAIVYLPRRKVLASGDLVAGDTPFIADVSPYDWIRTLDVMEKLDFDIMVPGHGGVMRGKDGLRLWREYFRELTRLTEEAVATGTPPETAVEQVSARLVEKFRDRFPFEFPQTIGGNVHTVYDFVRGR